MNIQDIRPACKMAVSCDTDGYRHLRSGDPDAPTAETLLPDRRTLGLVWRYLAAQGKPLQETPICLCRKIVRWSGKPLDLGQMMACLDIFADVDLLELRQAHKNITIRLTATGGKADLNRSRTMQQLLFAKEG
jgi:hypothetical protein